MRRRNFILATGLDFITRLTYSRPRLRSNGRAKTGHLELARGTSTYPKTRINITIEAFSVGVTDGDLVYL